MTAENVLTALAAIRAPQARDEYDLHGLTADALQLEPAFVAPFIMVPMIAGLLVILLTVTGKRG